MLKIGVALLVISLFSSPVLAVQDIEAGVDDFGGEEDVDYFGCYYQYGSGFWLESNGVNGLQTREVNNVDADEHIGHEPVGSAMCMVIGTKKILNPK